MNPAGPQGEVHVWAVAEFLRRDGVALRGEPGFVAGVGLWPRAIDFDGCKDGLVVEGNPLLGAPAFTVEAVFKPEPGGPVEQRFVHLQDRLNEDRVLLELRATDRGWFVDTFLKSGEAECVLADPTAVHPWSQWFVLALVCDGASCASWVNGVREMQQRLAVAMRPQAAGDVSLGQRLNAVSPFRGAIAAVRWSSWARSSAELWQRPEVVN